MTSPTGESSGADFQDPVRSLGNIQRMLAQLLNNRNNNDTGSNHDEEEHLSNKQPRTEKSKEGSSLDAEVLKASKLKSHP